MRKYFLEQRFLSKRLINRGLNPTLACHPGFFFDFMFLENIALPGRGLPVGKQCDLLPGEGKPEIKGLDYLVTSLSLFSITSDSWDSLGQRFPEN